MRAATGSCIFCGVSVPIWPMPLRFSFILIVLTLADIILKQKCNILVFIYHIWCISKQKGSQLVNSTLSLGNLKMVWDIVWVSQVKVLVHYFYKFCQTFLNYSHKVIHNNFFNNHSVCNGSFIFIPNVGDLCFILIKQESHPFCLLSCR